MSKRPYRDEARLIISALSQRQKDVKLGKKVQPAEQVVEGCLRGIVGRILREVEGRR